MQLHSADLLLLLSSSLSFYFSRYNYFISRILNPWQIRIATLFELRDRLFNNER